jgi:hypothetical protein
VPEDVWTRFEEAEDGRGIEVRNEHFERPFEGLVLLRPTAILAHFSCNCRENVLDNSQGQQLTRSTIASLAVCCVERKEFVMLSDSSSGPASSSFTTRAVTRGDVARWLRQALARNPFYIISAALLLLSMRLLSGDSRVFARETPQLLFNFSSFQVYELLLVGTAIVLARRKIWYDSGLLVGVETLFVFVPFILVSQALLLENQIALAFCLGGCALAALRVHGLKRWLVNLNMPAALLWMGAALLGLNLVFPVLTRLLHEHVSVPVWDVRGASLKGWEWNWVLPLAMGMAFFLPASARMGNREQPENAAFFAKASFPLLAFMLWAAGTAAHVYCIGYVYGLPWTEGLLVPTLWMASWMLWRHRLELDFVPEKISRAVNGLLLAGPLAVALFAAWADDWRRCCWLALLNVAAYGVVAETKRDRRALHLGLASAVVALAAMPHYWLSSTDIHSAHTSVLGVSLAGYLVFLTMCSRQPKWGIVGGIGLAGTIIAGWPHTAANAFLAVQLGLVFVVLHSLLWLDALHAGAARMRNCAAILWFVHAVVWMMADFGTAEFGTFLLGLSVLVVYFCARGVLGHWGPRIVPYTALASMALEPVCKIAAGVPETPAGVLVLIGSFALFALGTVAAMTKERWHGGAMGRRSLGVD